MCRLVAEAAARGGQSLPWIAVICVVNAWRADKQVIADARRIAGEPSESIWMPTDPRELSSKIFHTCYMGTENSSSDTRGRARRLAEAIGS